MWHRVVWYICTSVFEGHPTSVFRCTLKMDAPCFFDTLVDVSKWRHGFMPWRFQNIRSCSVWAEYDTQYLKLWGPAWRLPLCRYSSVFCSPRYAEVLRWTNNPSREPSERSVLIRWIVALCREDSSNNFLRNLEVCVPNYALLQPSAQAKNTWIYTSTPQHIFTAYCLISLA
jgi:hypothetical protein